MTELIRNSLVVLLKQAVASVCGFLVTVRVFSISFVCVCNKEVVMESDAIYAFIAMIFALFVAIALASVILTVCTALYKYARAAGFAAEAMEAVSVALTKAS